ncbi:hypothetical protein D7I39_07350 [Allopusillimonas ginsengisoli]|nr:hypothetical protein D7I39_07350 [Allopusillimonas ginsengisoli]
MAQCLDCVPERSACSVLRLVFCLLTQTLIVHIIRTSNVAFIESRASALVMAMTPPVMAIGVFLPMGPMAEYFKLQALPWPIFSGFLVSFSDT